MESKIEKLKELLKVMIELEEYRICAQIKDIIDRYERLEGSDT
jgi:protein-arginine kinase activator protein McsA